METVTISVLAYNSSKFILETLESVKNQTYPRLILRICDDCSTDNTVALCNAWIEKNKNRFECTDIILPDRNTGISANCNRAWDACTTKYQKEIAADDILLPNCIADNMSYVEQHPDAVFVFSRMRSFGASKERCRQSDEETYLYDLFSWTPEKQYDFLYNRRNCIPAPTCFVNIEAVRKIGLRHDERVPMVEDVPKWLNALRLGIKFDFFDIETVRYRIHNGSLSTAQVLSKRFTESNATFWFYYYFIPEYRTNPEAAVRSAVKVVMGHYNCFYGVVTSRRFVLMQKILRPFDNIRRCLMGFKKCRELHLKSKLFSEEHLK